jgi:hypothetical protein
VYPLLTKFGTAYGLAASYLRGWRTSEPILVIESDDWGCSRTASREAYERLIAAGYRLDRSPYGLDALETDEDLDRLFDVLQSVRDSRGKPAVLTANMILANPDFDRIRDSGYEQYFWRPVRLAMAEDPARRGVADRWSDGLARGLFFPQLHAREHPRWWRWLQALRRGSVENRLAFDLGMTGLDDYSSKEGLCFYAPLYLDTQELAREGVDLPAMIREGADLFEQAFGYRSLSTIAPNYAWHDEVERLWAEAGIRYIQGSVFQRYSMPQGFGRRAHVLGEKGCAGGRYLIRNCYYEPAEQGIDWVARCSRAVARAFRFHKPAVIGSHRVNYVGSIDPAHRDRNLEGLKRLLEGILARWPGVRFMTSVDLGQMIEGRTEAVGPKEKGQSL